MRATTLIPLLAVLAAAAPAAAAVDLTGESVSASFFGIGAVVLTTTMPFASPATVGPGVEFTGKGYAIPGRVYTFTIDVNATGFDLAIDNTVPYGAAYSASKIFGIHLGGLSGIGAISLDDYSCVGAFCDAGGLGPRVVTATSDASTADVTFSALRPGETYSFKFADPVVAPPVAPVPEPSTWALMITGFGLAGAALRRRRALFA